MRRLLTILLTGCLVMSAFTAWAYWTAGSATGGNGAAAVSTVNQGATPTASAAGYAVTVAWAPTTLTSGQAVTGYTVKRYSGPTAQTILTACTGTITVLSCVESNVPTGVWTYSVTPVFATNWVGLESARSSNVVVGNVAPTAVADSYSMAEDAVLTVGASGVLGNDSDPNSDPLTAILASGVANGAVSFSANGGFTYTPNPNFNGSDSFSYKANDGTQDSNVVTVPLTVTAVNDAPVNSVPGPQQTPKGVDRVFSTANNNPISISDVDAGSSPVQVQLNATNGTVALPVTTGLNFSVGNGTSAATMTFTGTIANINLRLNGAIFTPTSTFTGAATLQIVTSDQGSTGTGGTLTATSAITINVNSLGIFTANQDIGTAGDPVLNSGGSTYSGGTNGTYTVKGGGSNIWGSVDHFQYLYRDLPGDGRLTAKVTSSSVTPTTQAGAKAAVMFRESTAAGSKQAMLDLMQTAGTEFMFRVTADQTPATSGASAVVVAPYWIRITRVGNVITAEYSPNGTTWTTAGTAQTVAMNASIKVGLAVTAQDNTKLNTVTYDNVALTTPPTAFADAYATNENATLTVAARGVLANDTDPESDALTAVLVSGTTGLTLNADGSFTYVPPANFSGAASFTYKANDGVFDSTNVVTVNLTVNPANQVPSFTKGANQSVAVVGGQTVAGWATAISQGTGDSGQLVDFVVTNTNNPLFSVQPTISAAGTLTYTPAGPTGVATVSVNIHDNGGTANGGSDTSAVQTFTITVDPPDSTPPVNAISLSVVTGGSYESGNTVYYRGTAAGSFTLPNAVSDAGSGPASSATAALGGTTTGWSHTPSTVSAPAGGPYVSNSFNWTAGATSAPTEVVTGRDVAGNTAQTTLTFANDSTAPTGGTVTYAARTTVDTTVSVSFATGTDAGSGVGTRLLQRASATLTGGTCLAFGAFATVSGGTNPTSAVVDTTIPGNCYLYQYVVADNVGNSTTATSVNVWKVAIATQMAYVANNGTNNVNPVNVSTGVPGTSITVATNPRGVAFTPDGAKAYVTNTGSNTVSVITVATGAVAASIPVGSSPRGVAFTPDGTKAYVANYGSASVSVITVATGVVTATITVGTNPSMVAFTPDGTKAYVTNNGTTTVSVITVATGAVATTITVGSGPTGVAFTPDGTKAYVVNFTSGTVTPITVATNTAGTAITVGTQPFGLAITPDGAKVYVANNGSTSVSSITVATNTVAATINAGAGTHPYAVAFTPDGTMAYVTDNGAGATTIIPITVATGTVGTAITVGTSPYGVAMVPDQGPTAALAVITGAAAGSPVSLDATASTGTTTAIATYTFDFGDASTPTTTASPTTTHTYASAGSYTVTLTVTDAAGTSTTRVFTGQTVSRNGSAAATTTGPVTITAADTTGPTGGSVDASGLVGTGSRYAASTTLSLVLAKGTDASGVAMTGNLLKRASATLTSGGTADGTCGAFGSYITVTGGTDPVSPKSDTVADQACYSYQYVVLDTQGNSTSYTSPAIKVDLTVPGAPTLAYSGVTDTYWPGSGTTVFYRSAASSGSFVATATATDLGSGILSYSFPTLGTNWTSTPGALGVNTYSWTGAPAAPGTKNVTATNNATGVSGNTSLTPTADDTAPSAGSVTPPNVPQTSASVSVAFTTGTDGGSGVGTRLLQRQSATLTGTTCGSYGGWTTAATNPASSPFSDTVAGGFCYQYQYVVADNVGNTSTATSGNVVQVTAASTTVKAQYNNNEPLAPNNNSIQPHLQLVNTSASGADLSTITVRYWFTTEAGASTFAAPCYYASVGCSNVTTSVVAISPRTGADAYLLVGFLPSFTVAAGASSEVQLGLNKTDWSNFNEVDDYSYGTGTTYADSTTVTVYQGGTLIWGTEP